MTEVVNIAIVDDHEVFTEGLRALLGAQECFNVVATASDGEAAVALAETQPDIDVMLIDVDLPGMGGIDVLKHLQASSFKGKLLMLSMYDNPKISDVAMDLGASGYVVKSEAYDLLAQAIESVMAGNTYLSPEIKDNAQQTYEVDKLTKREIEICILFANGMRFDEIAAQLGLSHKTVEAHRRNVYQKLNLRSAVDITHLVINNRIWFEQACPKIKVEIDGRATT